MRAQSETRRSTNIDAETNKASGSHALLTKHLGTDLWVRWDLPIQKRLALHNERNPAESVAHTSHKVVFIAGLDEAKAAKSREAIRIAEVELANKGQVPIIELSDTAKAYLLLEKIFGDTWQGPTSQELITLPLEELLGHVSAIDDKHYGNKWKGSLKKLTRQVFSESPSSESTDQSTNTQPTAVATSPSTKDRFAFRRHRKSEDTQSNAISDAEAAGIALRAVAGEGLEPQATPTPNRKPETVVIPSEEARLVASAKAGDNRAFTALFETTRADVYTMAYRLTGNDHDAEDVAQEAFLRAFNSLKKFRGDARFSTWMYRITANVASSTLTRRSKGRHDQLSDDDTVLDERPESNPEGMAEAGALRDKVKAALADLPPVLRAVVVLRDVYDLPHDAIASELGITESAAKVRLHRARRKLRERLFPGEEKPEQ